MPTPKGKPKKGERIRVQLPGQEPRYGTVLVRYDGLSWGLKVLPDGETRRAVHIPDASWLMEKGYLKCMTRY